MPDHGNIRKKRKKEDHPALDFFEEVEEVGILRSNVKNHANEECKEKIKVSHDGEKGVGTRIGNLYRHLKQQLFDPTLDIDYNSKVSALVDYQGGYDQCPSDQPGGGREKCSQGGQEQFESKREPEGEGRKDPDP